MSFDRITVDPDKVGGVPSTRGLRIPVATVVGMVTDGMGEKEILEACSDLEREDVREALRYAAEAVGERESPLTWGPNASFGVPSSRLLFDNALSLFVAGRFRGDGHDAIRVRVLGIQSAVNEGIFEMAVR